MIEHINNMQKTLSELQQTARKGYLTSKDQWDAYSSIQAIALQMENEISENNQAGLGQPRMKAYIQAFETIGVKTSDEIKSLIKRLELARVKMIYKQGDGI